MLRIVKSLKNIKPLTLLIYIVITMIIPVTRTLLAEEQKLLVFTNTITLVALPLLLSGFYYHSYLDNETNVGNFIVRNGLAPHSREKSYKVYRESLREQQAHAFNYSLFLGVIYMILAAVIACTIL